MFRSHPLCRHACVKEKKPSVNSMKTMNRHTVKVHKLYLFDIVACLCTCFNKQNIHVFRSLLSLFCSYLSAMGQQSQRTTTHRTHKHTTRQQRRKISTVINLKQKKNKSCPFLLLLPPLLNTRSQPLNTNVDSQY